MAAAAFAAGFAGRRRVSAVGWLAVAAAVLLCAGPAAVPARAARLVDGARLAARPIAVPPLDWTSQRWLPGCGAVIAVAVVGRTGGAALAAAAAAVVSCLALIARDAVRGRSRRARHADLLLAVRVLVGELAAGARPPAALDAAAEAAPSHREVLARRHAKLHSEVRPARFSWRMQRPMPSGLPGSWGTVRAPRWAECSSESPTIWPPPTSNDERWMSRCPARVRRRRC